MQEKVEIKVIHWHKIDVDKPDTWPEKDKVVILYTLNSDNELKCCTTSFDGTSWFNTLYTLFNGQLWHYALYPPSELTQQD